MYNQDVLNAQACLGYTYVLSNKLFRYTEAQNDSRSVDTKILEMIFRKLIFFFGFHVNEGNGTEVKVITS